MFSDFQKGKILLFDKRPGWTSFDVIRKLKGFLRPRSEDFKKLKLGHCGTLDPFATGLLVVLTGGFTKKISEFQDFSKTYYGVMEFGKTTPSLDPETPFDETLNAKFDHIDEKLMKGNIKNFIGKIEQIPPIYSALKLKGKRFCDYIHKNQAELGLLEKEILKKKRIIEIFDFEILKIEMPLVHFKVDCSKGTYIRSLAHDFAKSLGSSVYLKELRRTRIGEFHVNSAVCVHDFCSL
jgi:tRNA pseudouridine55 synthase